MADRYTGQAVSDSSIRHAGTPTINTSTFKIVCGATYYILVILPSRLMKKLFDDVNFGKLLNIVSIFL